MVEIVISLTRGHSFAILLTLLSLVGCSPTANDTVKEWQTLGWQIEKVHGIEGPIQRHAKLMSEQAKAVEASWVENGVRKTKIYPQSRYQILVLRFFKTDGDQFAVVMKKRK